jgi:pimeloyl-ACP methyl ester carboxylesterase
VRQDACTEGAGIAGGTAAELASAACDAVLPRGTGCQAAARCAAHLHLVIACLLAGCLGACLAGCLSFHSGAMPGEPRQARFAVADGVRLRFLDVGQGPAVVLLHGFASSLDTWERLVPELQRTHRVLAVDLKGFGWSDRPPGDYSPAAQAALVLKLLEQRGIGRTALVAHSYGAAVALAIALAAPARVTRIALYDAWVYEDQMPSFFVWARAPGLGEALFALFYGERPDDRLELAFYDRGQVSEKLVEDVERAMLRPGTRAAALATTRGMAAYAALQQSYSRVSQPVLLLWGREDTVTPLAVGERLAGQLPAARLVVYPRCGHLPMLEAATASSAELLRFLAEARP